MITRGQVIVEKERNEVFPIIRESCYELNVNTTETNETSFYIAGKSPTFRYKLDLKIGAKLEIFLKPYQNGTLIEIYDHLPTGPDKRFVEKFFKAMATRIPLLSQYSIEAVKKEDVPKPFEEYLPNIVDNLKTQNIELKSMIDPSLIKKYEYSLETNPYSETNEFNANKIILHPIENGSKIEFLDGGTYVQNNIMCLLIVHLLCIISVF